MNEHKVFVNRRCNDDRRNHPDPCKNLPVDIYHRKRRKTTERRTTQRTLAEDYMAFFGEIEMRHSH